MLIGIDIDGVIADFGQSARNLCKKLFNGRPADSLVQTEWDYQCVGISPAEESMMWHVIDTTPNWWLNLNRLPNTDHLEALDAVYDTIFITNRNPASGMTITQQTKYWLQENTGLPAPTVICTKHKGALCKLLDVKYFIDDKPENCVDVAIGSPDTKVFLSNTTYNDRWTLRDGIERTDHFNSFAADILWRERESA